MPPTLATAPNAVFFDDNRPHHVHANAADYYGTHIYTRARTYSTVCYLITIPTWT